MRSVECQCLPHPFILHILRLQKWCQFFAVPRQLMGQNVNVVADLNHSFQCLISLPKKWSLILRKAPLLDLRWVKSLAGDGTEQRREEGQSSVAGFSALLSIFPKLALFPSLCAKTAFPFSELLQLLLLQHHHFRPAFSPPNCSEWPPSTAVSCAPLRTPTSPACSTPAWSPSAVAVHLRWCVSCCGGRGLRSPNHDGIPWWQAKAEPVKLIKILPAACKKSQGLLKYIF